MRREKPFEPAKVFTGYSENIRSSLSLKIQVKGMQSESSSLNVSKGLDRSDR